MFNISYTLNKQANLGVVFCDKNFNFLNFKNVFSKSELEYFSLFKNEFLNDKHLFIDLVQKNKKKKFLFVKVNEKFTEYEFQKIGGEIYDKVKAFDNSNIFFESLFLLKKNQNLFILNFFIGFFSKSYNFVNFKLKKNNKEKIKNINVIVSNNVVSIVNEAKSIFSGIELTRNLVTLPANILNPKKFVDEISKLKKIGLKIDIFNEKKLKKLGMNALLGVGQGSFNDSYLAIMRWDGNKKSKDRPLAFVGKGVCFDTGGISLKPAKFMEDMKYDMGGAGTVTGLMKTLALRKAKVNAVGVVGLVENMVDGKSQRPGDVIKSYSGQSIEILNTDAEGRLVLADAIAYTEDKFKPKFIINLATLTGAIIIALGNEYAGLFSNDDKLANQIQEISLKDNEKAWRLPLNENFDKLMDSKIADMQNINYSGGAGSITAAQFLQRFIRNKTPWAHLDIAGMAWTKKNTEVIPEGATGYGVKLLNRLVKEHYEK